MARAAFVMDRVMQWVGLPGKSFVPLMIGFGCNVPAILATRTLESKRDRLMTILMAPFMSCGARLAIFAVFASAFFPKGGAWVVFLLYVLGIVIALATGWLIEKTLLKGQSVPFMIELPNYHLPQWSVMLKTTWQRLKGFLLRAGALIIPICVLVGSLNSIEPDGHFVPAGSSHSILSRAGQWVTPVFNPIGIDDQNWPATVGLLTGTLAKEVVVGTLNTLYTQSQAGVASTSFDLKAGLLDAWHQTIDGLIHIPISSLTNPFLANEADHDMSSSSMGTMVQRFGSALSAFAFMVFVLLYV
ncbi:MAG: ferrous iron transport protein B, partial [Gammaproteobacteria bacterium]|nr:ferrous iron transport protein B [Gammaproteobacteria bacterium]